MKLRFHVLIKDWADLGENMFPVTCVLCDHRQGV